jgi:hypothetical protein
MDGSLGRPFFIHLPGGRKEKTAVGQFLSYAHFIHIYGGFDDSKPPFLYTNFENPR